MKTTTLLKVWMALALGWSMFFGPGLLSRYRQEGLTEPTVWILTRSAWLLLLSLASALALHILYRRGVRRQTREAGAALVIDASPTRVLPGVAQGVAALGVALLLGQRMPPACGGIVLGLLLTAAGAFLLRREILRVEPGRCLLRGSHLLGYPLSSSEMVLPGGKPLRLEHLDRRGICLLIGEVTLAAGLEHTDALQIAEAVGPAIGREVKDNTEKEAERSSLHRALHGLSRLAGIAALLFLAGVGIAWMVPAGRSALCRIAVAPHTPFSDAVRFPAMRAAAARCLAEDPTDENLLTLVRVANTADPAQSPEAFEAAVSALLILAGEQPAAAEGDIRSEAVGRINRWAAQRLGRPLDAHGGVLGWYPVEGEKYRRALDQMAGEDAHTAAVAWSMFGLGDLTHPEDFLWAAGPALADRRPIHFVLQEFGAPEAAAVPREGYPSPILAETVGEAVALRLWSYDGVGSAEFPEDFWAWWAEYARARHLPPGGPGAR